MKNKWRKFGFALWTLLVIAALTVLGYELFIPHVYTGTNIRFMTGKDRHLLITAEAPTIEVVSADFFLLRKNNGETVMGVPTDPPLGWASRTYFKANPQQISPGYWIVQDGYPTVHLTSLKLKSMVVQNVYDFDLAGKTMFGFILIGLVVWVVVGFRLILHV